MSNILKVYTGEQLYTMFRDQLLSKNVGLTNFNDGSKTKALIQAEADIISVISMDLKESLYRAIPEALYVGFGFSLKNAVGATGFLRPYRKPAMTLTYLGSGTSTAITVSSTQIQAGAVGAPGDAFTYTFASKPKISDLVTAINGLTNWSASLVKDVQSSSLYQYSGVNSMLEKTWLNGDGMDLMLATDAAITIYAGYSVTVDSMQFLTLVDAIIPAGKSGVSISSQCSTTGLVSDILANGIDTINGKGVINSIISGIDACINDIAFSGGADQETTTERKVRFSKTVNALNAGTANGITVALEGITSVRSAYMRENYPFRGMNTIVVDDGTGTISPSLLASLNKVLYGDPTDIYNYPGKNAAGIGYTFIAPTTQQVDIGITAYFLSTSVEDSDVIKLNVKSAVEQYINTLIIGADVILSEIIRVAKNSDINVYDIVINSPAANITIDATNVARTGNGGTVTVTMVVTNGI